MNDIVVKIKNVNNLGLVVSSRTIAEQIGKEHKNVIRDLEKILTSSNLSPLIIESNYKDKKGELRKEYLLTKKGFILYMFNIQGYNEFKLDYINKFEEMEQIIRNRNNSEWLLTRAEGKLIRRQETDVIQELILYAKEQGSKNYNKLYMVYSKLVNSLVEVEPNSRDKIEFKKLMTIHQLEDMFSKIIFDSMQKKIYYKEIYQICKERGCQLIALVDYNIPLLEKVS